MCCAFWMNRGSAREFRACPVALDLFAERASIASLDGEVAVKGFGYQIRFDTHAPEAPIDPSPATRMMGVGGDKFPFRGLQRGRFQIVLPCCGLVRWSQTREMKKRF